MGKYIDLSEDFGCLYPFIVIFLLLFFSVVPGLYRRCTSVKQDELLLESVKAGEDGYIYIVHSWDCYRCKKSLFKDKEKVSGFIKYKYYVYDYCIDKDFAKALDLISEANAKLQERYFRDERNIDLEPDDIKQFNREKELIEHPRRKRHHLIYYYLNKEGDLCLIKGSHEVDYYLKP